MPACVVRCWLAYKLDGYSPPSSSSPWCNSQLNDGDCFVFQFLGTLRKTEANMAIGDRVIVSSGFGSRPGILKYMGETQFAPGTWCGLMLDDPTGKNDGTVDGVRWVVVDDEELISRLSQSIDRSCHRANVMIEWDGAIIVFGWQLIWGVLIANWFLNAR